MNSPAFYAVMRLAVVGMALVQTAQGALEWTLHPIPRDGTNNFAWGWMVAYGNGKFVAIEDSGQTYTAPGTEPEHWTRGERIPGLDLSTIIFAAGKFAAVGLDLETTQAVFLSSTDGTQWTRRRLESDARLSDVAYGNGRFVAVGGDTVAWSTNGVDWVVETDFVREPKAYIRSVDFVNGEFMATFFDEVPDPFARTKLATSNEGRNWQEHDGQWFFAGLVAYGRNIYVGLGETDCVPCGSEYVSADGRTWEERGLPGNVNGLAIAYANGVFAISGWGEPSALLSSTDGVNWDEFKIGTHDFLPGLTFGAGRFVAVGRGQVAVSGFVGRPPLMENYRLSAEAVEFDFEAEWKTEWLVEASEDLMEWRVVKEFEGAEFGPEKLSVPREGKGARFVRVKEKR